MIICICNNINEDDLKNIKAEVDGKTSEEILRYCGGDSCKHKCGKCKEEILKFFKK